MNPEPIYVGMAVWGALYVAILMAPPKGPLSTFGKAMFAAATLALCIGIAGVLL